MKKIVLCFAILASACTQKVDYAQENVDKANGVVMLSYKVNPYLQAETNAAQGRSQALEMCSRLQYRNVGELAGESKECAHPTTGACAEFKVTRRFQCYN